MINGRFYIFILIIPILCSGCYFTQKTCSKMLQKAVKNGPYDAIIVPGIPYTDPLWGRTMKGRVYWSYILYKNGVTKNVIYSGSAVYTPYVEAEVMGLYGEAIGIPKGFIYTESTAEHSTENLYYSYQLAKRQGFKKIALATDPFQAKMLKKFSKKFKLDIPMIPMVYDSLDAIAKTDPTIDAQKAMKANFVALPDRESFWERLRGTRGKKIKFEEE